MAILHGRCILKYRTLRYRVIEIKLQLFSQKLRVLKAKVPYQGIKNGPIGKSSASVGDIP